VPKEGNLLGEGLVILELFVSIAFLSVLVARLIGLAANQRNGTGGLKNAMANEEAVPKSTDSSSVTNPRK
jgi:hypothetical protein